jgi:hypothetical protein
LRELTHCINNELTSTVGFVTSMAAHSGDEQVKAALARVVDRILDCARVYRALQMSEDDQWLDASIVLIEHAMPGLVAHFGGALRRIANVGEKNRSQHSVRLWGVASTGEKLLDLAENNVCVCEPGKMIGTRKLNQLA